MGARAAKRVGIPVIATVHGQVKYDLRSSAIQKILDSVICVRETSFRETQSSKLLKEKSRLILNGVTQYTDEVTREDYKLMYGSRLDKRHAWLLLLLINEVMPKLNEKIPKIKLSIWGDGTERQVIEKAIAESDKNLAIEYHGFTNKLGKEYKSATLALACARSAMDALVAGINVLPVNYHHLGKIIDSDNYEYFKRDNFEAKGFEKPDVEALCAIIIEFFANIKKFQKEMSKLENKIKENLVVTTALEKLVSEYQKLIIE